MQVRPLPSAEVVLSSACERYCGPLRLPGQPPATSGFALIRRGGTPVVHWTGSPVVPCDAVRACRPCYPGGFPPARQLWWLWEHRPSPNVHRVGTLSLVTRLRLGSLRATACAVARPLGGRSSGNLVLWVTPHTSLELPGRTANSQGRTSTGKSHSIHGMRTLPSMSSCKLKKGPANTSSFFPSSRDPFLAPRPSPSRIQSLLCGRARGLGQDNRGG